MGHGLPPLQSGLAERDHPDLPNDDYGHGAQYRRVVREPLLSAEAILKIVHECEHLSRCSAGALMRRYLVLAVTLCPGCGKHVGDDAVFGIELHEGCLPAS